MPETRRWARTVHSIGRSPPLNVALFAFLLNLPWELMQVPLYARMEQASHWKGIVTCSQAALGDAVLAVLAYAAVAVTSKSRRWIESPRATQVAAFVGVSVLVTIVIENLATRGLWISSWTYAPSMPIVPGTGAGLAPLLQWLLLPPVVVWLVQRQIQR